jgi:hypothetical protein
MRRTIAIALVLFALPVCAASAADSYAAAPTGSSPGGQSASDQYVETLPTTRGPRAPGRTKHAIKISPRVSRKIDTQGGSDASELKTLAASPALGTPGDSVGTGTGKHHAKSPSPREKPRGGSTPAVPSAAIKAVDGGRAGIAWLVVALLAITGLALGAAGYQRRRHKSSDS